MTAKQFPSTVEVPTVQPTQLPNLPGSGGITITNNSSQFSADVSIFQTFPTGQVQTLAPHQSTIFPEGSPVWARVTPDQPGNPTEVQLGVWPGSPSAPQGAVDIANEITVNGTVDVGTITGTVQANITNANIPVTGTVDVSTATGSTVDVTGSTVSITAGQVVEVTNEPQGSLTVAGTVDISSVTGTVTVDASGSPINIDQLLSTFGLSHAVTDADTITFSPQPGTIGLVIILPFPLGGSNTSVTPTVVSGVAQVPHLVMNNSAVAIWEVGLITTTVTVSIPTAANWNVIEVSGPIQWPPVGVITFDVQNPATGADWSFLLPLQGKIKRISGQLGTDSTTASRWVYLVTTQALSYAGYISVSGVALGASETVYLNGWPGSAGTPQQVSGGLPPGQGQIVFPIPDEVLGIGVTAQSVTFGLQAGDQWSDVQIDVEAA